LFPSRRRSLSPAVSLPTTTWRHSEFDWVRHGFSRPSPFSALPPPCCIGAAPKCISGRTSYLRVRLAFHPYPQLIPWFFNTKGFGPPRGISRASPWSWVAHPVSGLQHVTPDSRRVPIRERRPIQTRFPCASRIRSLKLATRRNSPAHSSIGRPSGIPGPKTQHSPSTVCRHTVSGSVSLPSRGSFHLSLTVLVRYRSPRVFSLGRWSSRVPTGFLVSRGTQEHRRGSRHPFVYGAITRCGRPFQGRSTRMAIGNFPAGLRSGPAVPYNPPDTTPASYRASGVWALPLSLATTRGISIDFSSSGYLDVSVPRLAFPHLWIQRGIARHDPRGVAPFGDGRIEGCLAPTRPFRRQQRPSSALGAKASTVCP